MIMLHVTIVLTGCILFANIPVTESNAGVGGFSSGAVVNPFLVNQNVRFLPVPQYYPYYVNRYGTGNYGFSQSIIVPGGGNVVDSGFGGGTGFGFGGLIGFIITLAILSAVIRAVQNTGTGTGTGTAMGGTGAGAAVAAGAMGMGMGMGMMMMGGGGMGGGRGGGVGGGGGRGMMIGGGQDVVRGMMQG